MQTNLIEQKIYKFGKSVNLFSIQSTPIEFRSQVLQMLWQDAEEKLVDKLFISIFL
jgi:hypothetical protein